MKLNISLNDLPTNTNLFVDFINNPVTLDSESACKILETIQNKIYDRNRIVEVIKYTMSDIYLTEKQKANLQLLELNNTLTIATGQQAGFLGGSVYTLLKAIDTVRISNILQSKFVDNNFIPIFWIEDNDDDLKEASETYLFDTNYDAINYNLNFDDKICVSEKTITENDLDNINVAKNELSNYQFSSKIIEMIDNAYQIGNSWSESFMKLYQSILGETGILFISASQLMKSGIFKDLVLKEIGNVGKSKETIERSFPKLLEKGYHIQAAPSDVNIFYHNGPNRHKINLHESDFMINSDIISKETLLDFAKDNPDKFSPKVLLRPVFQDYVLPTFAYLAGPGEIAYHSEIEYLYEYFNVQKPFLLMRTSATIIDKKISRYLSKIEQSPEYFFRSFRTIEEDLANKLLGETHEEIFSEFLSKFNTLFKPIESYLLSIDSQLERSINGSLSKIYDQFDQLDKKAHSAAKRNNEELIKKYQVCSKAIFPNEKLQERSISPLLFLAQQDNLIDTLLSIKEISAINHIFIEI